MRKTGNLWVSLGAGLVLSFLTGGFLFAQTSPVSAFLDKTRVQPGERFVLSVQISGEAARDYDDPTLPDLSSFARFQGSGSSQQVQIINGRVSTSHKLDYYYSAIREGEHEIGPVRVRSGGREYATDPLQISVTNRRADPGQAAVGSRRDLFVVATPQKGTAFQNEAVVITYRIYTLLSVTSYGIEQLPETAGFWVENYTLPRSPTTTTEIIDGRRYTVATIKKMAVFPTTAGDKEISPLQIQCQVRVQRRTRSLFDDFFSRDLFGSSRTLSVESNPVNLKVLPLPPAGRPENFEGAVGRFAVSAGVKSESSRANQALSIRVRVEGDGNLMQLTEPKLKLPESFEVYPPEVEQELRHGAVGVSGHKTYEYVAVPRRTGSFSLDPIELAYFDPGDQTYKTARSEPLTLEIAPGDDSLSVDSGSLTKRELEMVAQDIRFIKTSPDGLQASSTGPGTWFWGLLVGPLAALAGAGVLRRYRIRLQDDVAWARAHRAARLARKRLSRARASLGAGDGEFYGEVDRALAGFVGDKLNLADPSLISHDVRRRLLEAGVSEEQADEVLSCREICDRHRFSPVGTSRAEREEFLKRTERCLADLGRQMGRSRT